MGTGHSIERLRWLLRKWRNRRVLLGKGFSFVHINKCGGTSIERSLGVPHSHNTAAELRALFGPARWERLYRFTVVRDPFARVVSLYNFRIKTDQTGMGDSHIGFEDWVCECFERQNPVYRDKPKFFLPCRDWLVDGAGRMLVDHVFKLEDLTASWPEIQRATGISTPLRHDNASAKANLDDFYSDATRALVARVFAGDFESFGYDLPASVPAPP